MLQTNLQRKTIIMSTVNKRHASIDFRRSLMSMEGISQTSAYQGGSLASQAYIEANNIVV